MKRKITTKLIEWKEQPTRKPLVLFGARQTGKTTSVLNFAKNHYEKVIHIDFYKQDYLKAAFRGKLDPASIVSALEALLATTIDAPHTLLFLDEIQACDEALTALKFFSEEESSYDVIAAGSLLGVHVARKGSFPVGYVDMLTMHPMDFEEFCWAMDQERAFDLVRECFKTLSYCAVHENMMDLYRKYLLIGGMPEAVKMFTSGAMLDRVRIVQQNILTAYVADMAKYASSADAVKIVETWESIPAQLAKESGSTKFMWRYVASGAKAERYRTAVDWLVAAGLINKCTQVSEGVAPLRSFEIATSFKLYLLDVGLLATEFDARPSDFEDNEIRSARFRGGIAENYAMQQLVASGMTPYYWGQQSTYEVDFVMRLKEGVVPIEVKSGEHVRAKSAQRFAGKYGSPYLIHMTAKNFGQTDAVKSIPLYAACLVNELA